MGRQQFCADLDRRGGLLRNPYPRRAGCICCCAIANPVAVLAAGWLSIRSLVPSASGRAKSISTVAAKVGVGIDSAGSVADSVTGWIVSTVAAKVGVGIDSAGSVADSVTGWIVRPSPQRSALESTAPAASPTA